MEIRDSNSSIVKRITFENSSNEAIPTLKLVTSDGNKEIRQDLKPHEIRHLFIPKIYQENRSRAGFINIKRKDANKSIVLLDTTTESIIYIPPEKLEGLDKEIDLDPEEEFQVDESNHGLYLLNYSDTENVTQIINLNKTTTKSEPKENTTIQIETTTPLSIISKENTTVKKEEISKEDKVETNTIANSTDTNTKLIKVENEKDKENRTSYMSDEVYNHFRPLESELTVEEMAPFISFGQKLGGQSINDNLTNSPSLSASTKTVNYIVAPSEKRKYNSRYSATEKYRNTSADEEEVNEDMDVSVVKNVIEKNKIRNSVKGPAPARHVGVVNAYRKNTNTTQTPPKPFNIAQLNVTDPIVQNVASNNTEKIKEGIRANTTLVAKELLIKTNATNTTKENIPNRGNVTSTPRNYTRSYFNLRRRPSRLTAASGSENIPFTIIVNATTTEKASTSVYTAVVTSVSITSSMKATNKTDGNGKELLNSTDIENVDIKNGTIPKAILLNDTETTTALPSTARSFRHRIRIRTTTTESSLNYPTSSPFKPTDTPITTDLSTKNIGDLKNEATTSRISERLANLFRQSESENTTTGGVIRPKNILKRRRPTTTTTTTTTTTALPIVTSSETPAVLTIPVTTPVTISSTLASSQNTEITENTFEPFVVTSRTSSESSSKPLLLATNSTQGENKTIVSTTKDDDIGELTSQNEEVVIEAEKSYTASYVLAGLGFLPVMAIVVFVLRNIANKKAKELDTEYEGYFDDGEIKKESQITPVARPPLPTPTKPDTKWEFPRNKLRLQTLLGQGNFGQVC